MLLLNVLIFVVSLLMRTEGKWVGTNSLSSNYSPFHKHSLHLATQVTHFSSFRPTSIVPSFQSPLLICLHPSISVIGFLLFSNYGHSLVDLIQSHGLQYHLHMITHKIISPALPSPRNCNTYIQWPSGHLNLEISTKYV